jgi:hypothetical protein
MRGTVILSVVAVAQVAGWLSLLIGGENVKRYLGKLL